MIYDVIGIGFGPSNIALAVALEESNSGLSSLFLESGEVNDWQGEMLLGGSDIQHNPLRDFITPVNPASKFGFVNYLHVHNRLFEYLNVGFTYPLRKEFNQYVSWVASHFDNVKYSSEVTSLEMVESENQLVWRIGVGTGAEYFAKRIILGTGRNLNIPKIQGLSPGKNCVHLTKYLSSIKDMPKDSTISVLGASQSAVEILLDLLGRGFKNILAIHRSFSFRLKDTSPFSDRVYFPEFVDYYHQLPPHKRNQLDMQVRPTNYSSADRDVIDQLYRTLYEHSLSNEKPLQIYNNTTINSISANGDLELEDIYTNEKQNVPSDLLILATGFLDVGRDGRDGLPRLIQTFSECFEWNNDYLSVERDYKVSYTKNNKHLPPIYMNGLCESSHGMGDAGSFSLLSYRARDILQSISA